MVARLGIFRALRACADCPRKAACRAWLEKLPGSYPEFRPNGPAIEARRLMDPHAMRIAAEESAHPRETGSALGEFLESDEVRQLTEADKVDAGRLQRLLTDVSAAPVRRRPH